MPADVPGPIGRVLGGLFRVLGLERGGGGVERNLYAAESPSGEPVEIECYPIAGLAWPDAVRAEFARAALLSERVGKAVVQRTVWWGEDGGLLATARERAIGEPIAALVERGVPLGNDAVVAIARWIGIAIAVLAEAKIVHARLDGWNVRVDRAVGRAQIGEIGFASVPGLPDVPRPRPRSVAASRLERFDDPYVPRRDRERDWRDAKRILEELPGCDGRVAKVLLALSRLRGR